jgi:hypothetical protein
LGLSLYPEVDDLKFEAQYLGPSGAFEDPTTGLTWKRGQVHIVDKETADRLQPAIPYTDPMKREKRPQPGYSFVASWKMTPLVEAVTTSAPAEESAVASQRPRQGEGRTRSTRRTGEALEASTTLESDGQSEDADESQQEE